MNVVPVGTIFVVETGHTVVGKTEVEVAQCTTLEVDDTYHTHVVAGKVKVVVALAG